MLGYTMRSRLVGLANKPFLRSRVFSTAPVVRERINLEQAFTGKLNLDWTPEIVTIVGMARALGYISYVHDDNAELITRAKASLKERNAHNCNLLFTPDLLASLPKLDFDAWQLQATAARRIIQHHQHRALIRANIFVSSTTAIHNFLESGPSLATRTEFG